MTQILETCISGSEGNVMYVFTHCKIKNLFLCNIIFVHLIFCRCKVIHINYWSANLVQINMLNVSVKTTRESVWGGVDSDIQLSSTCSVINHTYL